MSVGAIIAILIAIIVIVAAGVLASRELRRRALRQRFGTEYDRLVEEKGTRQAEAELTERQRRLAGLNIHDLDMEQQAGYTRQWAVLQERFVDAPADAVRRADELIIAVQRTRGYPADDPDQALEALTVDHARAVEGYRDARNMTGREDEVSTEQYRQALLQYRDLFTSLVGSPDGIESTQAAPAIAAPKE